MNLYQWTTYSGDHTGAKLAATFATSFPFDAAHAIGNLMFCLAFGPALTSALARYRTRFEIAWVPIAAAGALFALGLQAPAPAQAASSSAGYLARAQNADGGWGGTPGQASSGLVSGWAALGLAAEGQRNARALAYVKAHVPSDTGGLERSILVVATAQRVPASMTRALARRQGANGSFGNQVNTTAFAILAMKAAGRSTPRAAGWILKQQNADGGFNFATRGNPSGIDDTSAAVQALAVAGLKTTKAVRRAVAFVISHQNTDGGFPLTPGAGSNAQSTAWAVQAMLAAGRNVHAVHPRGGRDGYAYIRSLIEPNGLIRYSRTSAQTPVWVTGEAMMALAGKALPLPRIRS